MLMWWSGTPRDPSMKLDPAFHRHHRTAGGSLQAFIPSSSLKSLTDVRCCFRQDHLCRQPGPGRRRQPVRGPPLPRRSLGHHQPRPSGLRKWHVHVRSGLGEVLPHEDLPGLPVQEDGAESKGTRQVETSSDWSQISKSYWLDSVFVLHHITKNIYSIRKKNISTSTYSLTLLHIFSCF